MQVTSIVSFLVPTVETLSCMGCGTISSMALAADIMSAQNDFHSLVQGSLVQVHIFSLKMC